MKDEKTGKTVSKGDFKTPVKHIFADEEKAEIAQRIAENLHSKKEKEDELKAIRDQYKAAISTFENEIYQLSQQYRDGFVVREEVCELVLNFDVNRREYWSRLTGELAKTEPLTEADRQLSLF